jgi:DNA-binding NarL/FixJ family response regulator
LGLLLNSARRNWAYINARGSMVKAIRAVVDHKTYLSPGVSDIVIRDFVTGWQTTNASAFSVLSPREREVLQFMAEGRTTNQIADGLCVSVKIVEAHRQEVMTKFGIHSVAELSKYAIRQGLSLPEDHGRRLVPLYQ